MNHRAGSSLSSYAYRHVAPQVLMDDMRFRPHAPVPGDSLPEFELPLADGGRMGSAQLYADKPLLLVTGSLTCPMTASSNPLLKELHQAFGGRVQFAMLHVREAHPGEDRDQPQSAQEKMQHAQALKTRDALPWPVLVDDPEGTVHRSLDEKPNSAWIVDRSGRIVYRSLWAGDTEGLRAALGSAAAGEQPQPQESRRRMLPMARGIGTMQEMLRQAGPRARRDLWRAAPPMAAIAWVADLYRPLRPEWRALAAVATIAVVATAVVSALRLRRD